jgi:hypothetical protein
MGFLSKVRKGMKKRVAQMPRRRGGFLRGMPMMKPSIGDMRFRGRMPSRGGFGNLGEAIRRLNEQQGMMPQPIPRAERMPDQSTLDKFRQVASRPNPFVRSNAPSFNPTIFGQPIGDMDFSNMPDFSQMDLTNLQVPTDMPMTQDLPEVAPIGMMPQMRMGGMQDMEPRMMMQEGEDVSLERELFSLQSQLKNLEEQLRLDRSYNDDQAVINTSAEMAAIQKRIQEIMEGRPQLAEGGDFPDLTGDGKVTQADILKGRGVYAEGDEVVSDDIINDYLEGIAFQMVDKQGNVRSKRNEPIIAYTNALTEMVGPEQAQSLIAQAIERKKIENSQKYLDFLTSAPESAKLAEEYKMIQKMRGYAEGDEVIMEGNEIDAMLGGMDSEEAGAMEDLEQMAPEMEMIDQLVTMVVQMIQQGASEEEVIMFLREQGLDDEDIGTVLQLVAEMAEAEAMPQDGIGAELEQLA